MTGCLATPVLAFAQIPVPDIARIDAFIEDRMAEAKVPGVALALVYDGAIVHQRGFGVADPSGRPMTPQTPSSLGSITKSFTALAVMQLVEAAQIDLDEPVQRYVPWFRVADAESSARITVRHLLHHTTGLSTLDGNLTQAHSDSSGQALDDRVRHLARARLIAPPGEQYRYSNGNYQALGAIVQAVTGRAYEDYVQEHILTPMGMHNSFVYRPNGDQIEPATGYRFWFGQPIAMSVRRDYRGGEAQGGVFASAEDLAFYMFVYSALRFIRGLRLGNVRPLAKPFRYREIAYRVVMPFVFSAGTALGLLIVLFRFGSTTLSAMLLFVPDAGWLAVAGGVTASFWAMLRPLLLFRSAN